jgi:hypothetical protein
MNRRHYRIFLNGNERGFTVFGTSHTITHGYLTISLALSNGEIDMQYPEPVFVCPVASINEINFTYMYGDDDSEKNVDLSVEPSIK